MQAGDQVMSLLKPVSLTMVLVIFLLDQLGQSTQIRGGFSSLMVYEENSDDDTGTLLGGVLLNGLVVVGMLAAVTTALLLLYKWRCYAVVYCWLILSVASLLFAFGGCAPPRRGCGAAQVPGPDLCDRPARRYVVQQLFELHDRAVDAPSFYFVLYNFAAVGTLLVFWIECGCGARLPLAIQQYYLIFISALLAWSIMKLPEWTTWGLLASVAVWDLIAVLTPQGPLKQLVELSEARGEPIPGLVYQGSDIKLGLGDFVFYSVLVGRASMRGCATFVACALAVLAGLCATLALLPILQKVLPALPISIAVGIFFYFSTAWLLGPMIGAAAALNVFM